MRALTLCVLLCAADAMAGANPRAAPGDETLRNDLELLADAGVLRSPVTTWPLSWPDILRDVQGAYADVLDVTTAAALSRVQRRAQADAEAGFSGISLRASVAHELTPFRSFEADPRDEAEFSAGASWLGEHVVLNVVATAAANPADGDHLRGDGSYFGLNVGNIVVTAGYIDRWWGPGWDGSLILSTNARAIPGITIERNYSDPFHSKLLSWLGPWRATISLGQTEEQDVAVPNARFFAARVNAKPRPWLEFGLSRTAQWCGDGRPCGFGTFRDLLIGHDNQVENGSTQSQPGNQMAGYDARMRSPWKKLPVAAYTQWIGEDESGGLPSKFLGLFGVETWGGSDFGAWRVRAEYADTTCMFTRSQPQFGCAYRNALYPQGYTNQGRVIGDSLDNDSRMATLAGSITRPSGAAWALRLRWIDLNRDGGPHTISEVPGRINDVELRYSRDLGAGRISAAVGHSGGDTIGDLDSGVRGFLTWQQGF